MLLAPDGTPVTAMIKVCFKLKQMQERIRSYQCMQYSDFIASTSVTQYVVLVECKHPVTVVIAIKVTIPSQPPTHPVTCAIVTISLQLCHSISSYCSDL